MRTLAELGGHVGIFAAALAGAGRVAALRHEAFDDAMERRAVIEMLMAEQLETRATILGARSGRNSITTRPCVRSRSTVLAGSSLGAVTGRIGPRQARVAALAGTVTGRSARRTSKHLVSPCLFAHAPACACNVNAGTKLETSPPSRAISLTKREEMNW